MVLIHTALQSEAQYLIEYFKLKKYSSVPKVFKNENIVLVVSGIGKDFTYSSLKHIFTSFKFSKTINIGTAGCSNKSIEIGTLVCTNKQLKNIEYLSLQTVDISKTSALEKDENTLFDMEAKYFEEVCRKYISEENIYIFKVVSDYLSDEVFSKEFVKQLIKKNIKSLSKWI